MKLRISGKAKALIAVLVLAAVALGAYRYYAAKQAAEEAADVPTTVVEVRNLKSTVSATGTIRPVDSVEVSSRVTARLASVLVKENDVVKAGQVVATLDAKDYAAKRDQAQYKVTNMAAEYERIRYLYSIGADTQKQLEDAQMNYDTAVSELSQAQSDAAETDILAPMDGTVVGEPKTAGTMAVSTSDNPTVIMRIADLSTKQIMAKIDETDIGSVKVGQTATFTVDSFPNETFTARVSKISQTDTANTWDTTSSSSSSASVIYYYVTLDVDDPEGKLYPGMTARVDIETATRENAIAIPLSALKTDPNGSYVIVKHADGTQETRYIETGIYSDEYVEVLSGLSAGEEIVSALAAKTGSSSTKKTSNAPHGPMF